VQALADRIIFASFTTSIAAVNDLQRFNTYQPRGCMKADRTEKQLTFSNAQRASRATTNQFRVEQAERIVRAGQLRILSVIQELCESRVAQQLGQRLLNRWLSDKGAAFSCLQAISY
jgi:hypothetical protein